MRTLTCIIVDDEPLAQEVLRQHVARVERLELLASCSNATEAYSFLLRNQGIDLMLLDINMPNISGLDFLRSLSHPPKVIFTTANRDFAVEGFELNAIDYLLKPISFERFLKAVFKVFSLVDVQVTTMPPVPATNPVNETTEEGFLVIRSEGKLVKLNWDEIRLIEAYGEYVKVHTEKKFYITHSTMRQMEEDLPPTRFGRSHRSYLVAFKYIDFIEGNSIKVRDMKVPISRNLRDGFIQRFMQKG